MNDYRDRFSRHDAQRLSLFEDFAFISKNRGRTRHMMPSGTYQARWKPNLNERQAEKLLRGVSHDMTGY